MRIIVTQLDAPPPIPAAVATGIVAQPGGQAGATLLTAQRNIVTTVSVNCGVTLQAILGSYQWIFNAGTNLLLAFPPSGTLILGNATGVAVGIPPGGSSGFTFDNVSTWYPG